jgi:hypothetical protein
VGLSRVRAGALWRDGRAFSGFAVPLMAAGALAAFAPGAGSAPVCGTWARVRTPNPSSFSNVLNGVAVLSSRDAWAVGDYSRRLGRFYRTLILHWDGTAWQRVPGPNPGGPSRSDVLHGVAVLSSRDAWAVGSSNTGTAGRTLVVHWNGSAWTRVPSPNPGGPSRSNVLDGVTALSPSDAWAVGSYATGTTTRTLILHWNGSAWARVPSPSPGLRLSDGFLHGVTALSSRDAWAVGSYTTASGVHTLVLRWNGTAWKRVPSPSPGYGGDTLTGVTAVSASDAWAVGGYSTVISARTLALHWNGTGWKRVASPDPGRIGSFLTGVTATSATSGWAVGDTFTGRGTPGNVRTLILRWNGVSWIRVASPNPSTSSFGLRDNQLDAVAASSPASAWAVGSVSTTTADHTLAFHCH